MPMALLVALGSCPVSALARGFRRASEAHLGPHVYVPGVELPGDIVVSRLGNGTVYGRHLLTIVLGGQPLRVVVDTGSFGLVVSSSRCPGWSCPVRSFDHGLSNTYEEKSGAKVVKYMSGTVHLREGLDEMRLYNGAKPQHFWEITELGFKMKELWKQVHFDGILGLPWLSVVPGEGSANETSVTETFGVQAFSFCLGRATIRPHFQGVKVTPSFLYWAPPGKLQWGSTVYADIVTKEHWAVELGEVSAIHKEKAGPRSARFACYGGLKCLALIDSGAKVMSLPEEAMFGLRNQLGGDVKPDCSNYDRLPDLTFTVGGSVITMPKGAFVKRQKYSNDLKHPENLTEFCEFLIVANDVGLEVDGELIPLWIFGVPFLQEFIVEFDRTRRPARVGISPSPHRAGASEECPETPPSGPIAAGPLLVARKLPNMAAEHQVQLAELPTPDALTLLGGLPYGAVRRHPTASASANASKSELTAHAAP